MQVDHDDACRREMEADDHAADVRRQVFGWDSGTIGADEAPEQLPLFGPAPAVQLPLEFR